MKIILTEKQLKKTLKHIYQPTGDSCGPTCIKMVGEFFKGEIESIDEICKYCETDNIVGTPPERMKKGLNKLGIDYKVHIDDDDPFSSLKNVIDNGGLCILRTLTQGIPHWVVVNGYDKNNPKVFTINDPWLGPLEYSEKELDKIWKDRNYFFFEINKDKKQQLGEHNYKGDVVFRKYNPETDAEIIYNRIDEVLNKTGLSKKLIWEMIGDVDEDISLVAEVDGKIGGFYFLREEQIPPTETEEYNILSKLNGVEGVVLGVFEEYKKYGIGKDLIEYPKTLGYDYIWGYQLKSLENINDWLKRRKLYYEKQDSFITYQIFQN